MASHLTVTSSAAMGVGPSRPLNGQASAEADATGPNAFAAILGLMGIGTGASAKAAAPTGMDMLAGLPLDADAQGNDQPAPENPDALAAAINAVLPFGTNAPPAEAKALLQDVLTGLADLKQKLASGEPLEPEVLMELDGQLDALGEMLGIDLTSVPSLDKLQTLLATPIADDASLATRLAGSIAPLADRLLHAPADVPADAAALQKTVGEKLAALLGSMGDGEQGSGALAELGLSPESEPDAELEAAIAKLLAPATKPETTPAAPVLAKPELQLSEPVLTGKASGEAAPAVDVAASAEIAPADAAASDQQGKSDAGGERGTDGKPAEARPAPVAANAGDSRTEPSLPAQSQHAARVDAAPAPRVIQAGYQTSQQQLNLPQIAFELARQTTEGNTRFQIRLDPAELGRIDVQLDIDSTGQVNARLVVEKSETLDLMQRDQRGLEKALHQAGLDSAKTNLEFSLKQNGGEGHQQQGHARQGRDFAGSNGSGEAGEAPPTINLYRASLSASGVNIIA